VLACTWEFPLIMENPTDGVFQVFVTPEETLLLFADGEARHIYTDRPHPRPADLWLSDLGNSVGHWEQDTLVIDTIDRKAGPFIRIPHFLSPDLIAPPEGGLPRRMRAAAAVRPLAKTQGHLPGTRSDQAHFTERLRMAGPDALQDEMTISDERPRPRGGFSRNAI